MSVKEREREREERKKNYRKITEISFVTHSLIMDILLHSLIECW